VHLCTSLRSLLAVSLERTIKLANHGIKFNRIAERTNGMHGVAPLKKATRSDSLSETCRTRIRFARSSIVSGRASRPEKEASDRDLFLKRATMLRNPLTCLCTRGQVHSRFYLIGWQSE